MTTAVLAPYLTQQFFKNNGTFNAGGLLYTYQAGTTTPVATYTNSTGATPNTNPIVLNARGEANIWLLPNVAYKFVLQDSSANPIWSVDQVTDAQLITLYGGVDTGTANAYVLNFTANFNAYTNGIVIYWMPANSNTGASTINVNGLGVVPIVNQSGGALASGSILANQVAQIMYFNGNFILLNPVLTVTFGTATAVLGGITGTVNLTCPYTVVGNLTTMRIPVGQGTSNATTFTLNIASLALTSVSAQWVNFPAMFDNTSTLLFAQIGTIHSTFVPTPSTTITLYKNGVSTGWTASGTKGVGGTDASTPYTVIEFFNS